MLGGGWQDIQPHGFFATDADQKELFALQSFQDFQAQLRDSSPEVPPQQELLRRVGSSQTLL